MTILFTLHEVGERSIRGALQEWGAAERVPRYLAVGLLGVLALVLAWSRLTALTDSFWHDEAYSVLNHNGLTAAFGGHVLFNQLSWATTSLLGESEAMHRFWSVVPGIVAVGLGSWWAWRRIGVVAAVAFAAIAVAAPLHLDIVPQARGYGLAMLAATLMLIAADRLTRAYSTWTLIGFLGAALMGIWTLIFFAASFVGQVLSLLRWPHLRRVALAVLLIAGAMSYAFHSPSRYGQVQGEAISFVGALLLERTLEWLVIPTLTLLAVTPGRGLIDNPNVPDWFFLAPLALIAIAIFALWRRGQGGLALLLILPPICFNLTFSIGELNTVARHQLVLFPHVLLLVATGVDALGRALARPPFLKPIAIAAGAIVVLVMAKATIDERMARTMPIENFKEAAVVARDTGIETIVTDSNRGLGLAYYLRGALFHLDAAQVEDLLCDSDEELVYIRHIAMPPDQWGHWRPASLDCLVGRDAARVRVTQRTRGYAIDVWIVRPEVTRRTLEDDTPYARGGR